MADISKIDVTRINQPEIINLEATSGTVELMADKIYSIAISGATTFDLPDSVDTNHFHQIKVIMKITGTPSINWGTTYFFNKELPEIEAQNYDVYFDYDNFLGGWVCGALPKGVV